MLSKETKEMKRIEKELEVIVDTRSGESVHISEYVTTGGTTRGWTASSDTRDRKIEAWGMTRREALHDLVDQIHDIAMVLKAKGCLIGEILKEGGE